jgi:hypothetical protein
MLLGRSLAVARSWFERGAADLAPETRDFVAASLAADAARRDAGTRRRHKTLIQTVGSVFVLLTIFAFSVWQLMTTVAAIEHQTEATLDAGINGLAEQYDQRGLSGLVQIVAARSAGDRGDAMLYLVTDPDGRPLAGNIAGWPLGVPARTGWLSFTIEARAKGHIETHLARGSLIIIPGGYRLLVGRDINDMLLLRYPLKWLLVCAGLLVVGVCFWSGIVSRDVLRDVKRVELGQERALGPLGISLGAWRDWARRTLGGNQRPSN